MKQKITDFFLTIWYYVSFPYYWLSTRKIDKLLTEAGKEYREKYLTENSRN